MTRIQRDNVIKGKTSSRKVFVIPVGFYRKLKSVDRFSQKAHVSRFTKIRLVGAEVYHADGQTDGDIHT